MKNKLTNFIIFLIMISTVIAFTVQITYFTGQTNPFNVSFKGELNKTFFLNFPNYAKVENITLIINQSFNNITYDNFNSNQINNSLWDNTTQIGGGGSGIVINKNINGRMVLYAGERSTTRTRTRVIAKNNIVDMFFKFNLTLTRPSSGGSAALEFIVYHNKSCVQSGSVCANNPEKSIAQIIRTTTGTTSITDKIYHYKINDSGYASIFDETGLLLGKNNISTLNNTYLGFVVDANSKPGNNASFNISIVNITQRIRKLNITLNQTLFFTTTNFTSTIISIPNELSNGVLFLGKDLNLNFITDYVGTLIINITNATYEYGIDDCSTFTNPILNFTYFDELQETVLNPNIGYDLTFTGGFIQKLNGTITSKYSNAFCTNMNNSERNLNWNVTGQIILDKTKYATRINNYDIGNYLTASNNPSNNVSLFLINLTSSSSIQYTVLSTSFQPIDGTLLIFQCNGDGTRTQVSSTPISNGLASDNVELINIPYSYDISINGVLFQDFDSYGKCSIEPTDTRRILVNLVDVDFVEPSSIYGISCNLTKPSSDVFLMQWGTNTLSDSVITGCVYAKRLNLGVYTTFYTQCSTTKSLTGTVVVDSGYSYIVEGKIFQNDYTTSCDQSLQFAEDKTVSETFGLMGLYSVIVLVVFGFLLFSGKGSGLLFGTGVGVMLAYLLGLLPFGWMGVSLLLTFLIIIGIIGRNSKK